MSERNEISGWGGPYADAEPQHTEGSFIDRIRDPSIRTALALHISTNGFYGNLDFGHSFDSSLDSSMHLAIANKALIDSFVENEGIPDTTWSESSWHAALDEMLAGQRPDYEPGKIRKNLARFILRQEITTKRFTYDLAPWRKRSPTSTTGTI